MALALAIASRPAFASEPPSALTHATWSHATLAHSASVHALPASLAASTHRDRHLHHRHHAAHHASLTRDLSACGPSPLPVHPAGLPHSGKAAAAHHAPTLQTARQGKGSSRAASFLAERFAWGVDRLSFTMAVVERGIAKNLTFDVNAGRGPPRAGPYGDISLSSAWLAFPAATFEHPTHPANSNDAFSFDVFPSARRRMGVPCSVAAFAFREPAYRAASLGERCRMNRSRLTPSPAIAAPEARRVA